MKKLHGLNTHLTVQYVDPIKEPTTQAGDDMEAWTYTFHPALPSSLNTYIPGFSGSGDLQHYLKRMYQTVTLNNTASFPLHVDIYKLYCRRDASQTLDFLIDVDVTSSTTSTWNLRTLQYAPISLGNEFRRTWKILSKKRKILNPMRPWTFKAGIQKGYLRHPITSELEGNNVYWARKGAIVTYLKIHGVPCNYDNYGNTPYFTNGISPMRLRGVISTYASWYTMADATPTSSVTQSIGTTNSIPFSMVAYNPSYVNAVNTATVDYQNGVGVARVFSSNPPAGVAS